MVAAALSLMLAGRGQALPDARIAPPERQETPAVLLPGVYLENVRKPLEVGIPAPPLKLSLCSYSAAALPTGQEDFELRQWQHAGAREATLVVFWAFWCDTWKDMTRQLNLMQPTLRKHHIAVVAVAVDASQQPVARPAFERGDIWWPVAVDESGITCQEWGVRRVPTLFLVDNQGVIRAAWEGFPGRQTFWKNVLHALRPSSPPVR